MNSLLNYIKNLPVQGEEVLIPEEVKTPLLKQLRHVKKLHQDHQTAARALLAELNPDHKSLAMEDINNRRMFLNTLDDIIRNVSQGVITATQIATLREIFNVSGGSSVTLEEEHFPVIPCLHVQDITSPLDPSLHLEDSSSDNIPAPISISLSEPPAKEKDPGVSKWRKYLCCCYCSEEADNNGPKENVTVHLDGLDLSNHNRSQESNDV